MAKWNIIWVGFFAFVNFNCRDKYEMMVPASETNILVVEGVISTNGETKINLSRSSVLKERRILFEKEAILFIHGEDNSVYPLTDMDSGRYVSVPLMLNEDIKYRLSIKTKDNREYVSDFMQPVKTPPIDSISYTRYNGGAEIFVNTNDKINNTQYYKWEYEETWEFRSKFEQRLVPIIDEVPGGAIDVGLAYWDPVYLRANPEAFTCWQSRKSSAVLIGNTLKLGENRVYQPLLFYPQHAWELSVLYSINVKQIGLSKEGYIFYELLKKNTESLGTIFDAMPSEIKSNIKCITDTTEKVIGHVDVTRSTEKRKFIYNSELTDWYYGQYCPMSIIVNNPDTVRAYFYYDSYLPIEPNETDQSGRILSVKIAKDECIDCRLRGTSTKPIFWPY